MSNRPPGFVCSGDQHATPYYALRRQKWKLLLGDPGADDNVTAHGAAPPPSRPAAPPYTSSRLASTPARANALVRRDQLCTGSHSLAGAPQH